MKEKQLLESLSGGKLLNRLGILILLFGLAPLLIGRAGANPVVLLGYLAVLDVAILYLAFHKQWRSLNHLAFLGTALVYALSQGLSNQTANLWINLSFLTFYFVIFGTQVFFYNIHYRRPTEVWDVLLLVLNAAFFFIASAASLASRYEDWLGLFAIILALLYLMVALSLKKRRKGDDLLFLSLLGTGLAFVTMAIPLQLKEMWVTELAWTVEALVLFFVGLKGKNLWVRWAAFLLLGYVLLSLHWAGYPYFETAMLPLVNAYSLAANLSVLGCFLLSHFLHHAKGISEPERKLVWPAAVLGTILAVKQLTWEVDNALSYFMLRFSLDFSVSLAWVAFALFLLLVGLTQNLKGFRYMSLILFGLTICKVIFFDLSGLNMILRMLILIMVGSILVGVSFIYQRREKGGKA